MDLYGIYMGFIWDLYGFIWDLYGIYMGFIWNVYGMAPPFDSVQLTYNWLN